MNEQTTMFGWGTAAPGQQKPSPTAALTARNNAALARGIHPATGLALLDHSESERPSCGSCAHAVQVSHNSRTYWKCERHRLGISRGAATDIRVGWPACTAHAPALADTPSAPQESMSSGHTGTLCGDRVPDHGGQT